MILYSASAGGFFDTLIHSASAIPSDAVEITEAEHLAILAGQSSGKVIQAGEGGKPELGEMPIPELAIRRASARAAIDIAAGDARARFVSPGSLIELEYQQAEQAVKDWREAGSPAEDVPADIQVWAESSGLSIEDAAVNIEQTSALWRGVLTTVRQIRLDGKAAVDAATDRETLDDMAAAAQPYIDQLNGLSM